MISVLDTDPKNPILHSRTKHLETNFYFVREKIQAGEMVVEYDPSKAQIIDKMTKSLHTTQFHNLKVKFIILEKISA